ncbi:MAG: hypothetical protein JO318_19045 [Chloroflexi bacterium]|nr:hypothetical protein [Chloroflexota bacterium]MBV9134812.1 hypothetical protein [Chloroflexota bacterium]
MARPAPPSDDGSPARLIATMVGIVGILLLGSLAWSAVGALVSAVGAAGSAFSTAASPPPPATLGPAEAVTPNAVTPLAVLSPVSEASTQTALATTATATPAPQIATATDVATPTPQVAATATAATSARSPWVLLPQPEPGAKVQPGQVTVEARGRGDAPITAMRLELDGAALPTALEQRSDTTWRGSASVKITAGQHNARVTVTDADGRTGSFRWTFTAAPGP